MWQDFVNGAYELLGGVFIFFHCYRLFRQKKVRGVSLTAIAFFASWGVWNLYYYPSLNQWCSFTGGIGIVAMNTLYISMLIYYILKEKKEKKDEII